MRKLVAMTGFAITLSLATPSALAGSHSWRVNELFSNPDGTIQFIELRECCGAEAETGLLNKDVISDSTGSSYTFLANIVGPTNDKHLLLATQGFADLPGAPAPTSRPGKARTCFSRQAMKPAWGPP